MSTTTDLSPQAPAGGKTARQGGGSVRRARITSTRGGRLLISFILPLAILALWQIVSSLGLFTVAQLPSPEMVWLAGVDLIQRGLLGPFIGISVQRVLVGFAIGAALGLLFGAIVGLSRIWDSFFGST